MSSLRRAAISNFRLQATARRMRHANTISSPGIIHRLEKHVPAVTCSSARLCSSRPALNGASQASTDMRTHKVDELTKAIGHSSTALSDDQRRSCQAAMTSLGEDFNWNAVILFAEKPYVAVISRELQADLVALTQTCLRRLASDTPARAAEGPGCLVAVLRMLGHHHHDTPLVTTALIKRATHVFERDLPGVRSTLLLIRLLNVVGDNLHQPTENGVSAAFALAVYRQLAAGLAAFRPVLDKEAARATVFSACLSLAKLRVRDAQFLAAWERFMCAVLLTPGAVRSALDLRACAAAFSHLRHEAPTLFRLMERLLAMPGAVPAPHAGHTVAADAELCWAFLAQGFALPTWVAERLVASLLDDRTPPVRPYVVQMIEQLLPHLPGLDVPGMARVLRALHSVEYLHEGARAGMARLAADDPSGGGNVVADAVLLGGRVPLVAMVDARGAAVLPWPRDVLPATMSPATAAALADGGCVPVAVLLPRRDRVLRVADDGDVAAAPPAGVAAHQRSVLQEQGYRVLVVSDFVSVLGASKTYAELVLTAVVRCANVP